MKRYALLASALVLVGVASFVAGRATAPVRTETRVVTTEGSAKTVYVAVKQQQSQQVAAATDKGKVVTRWRRVVTPAGPCEEQGEREETRDETRTSAASSTRAETETAASEVKTATVEKTKVAEAPRDRFQAAAMLGLDVRGTRLWGGQVGVRVLGPVVVGAWALPPAGAGGLYVGARW